MAYTPTNWQTGDVVTAERLNKLEGGVASLSNYDIVFTATNDSVTADGLSFEDLYQKGAENITAKHINRSDETTATFLWSVRALIEDGVNVLNFVFGPVSTFLRSDGKANIFDAPYTYTYSNGHYVFTPTEPIN